MAKFVPGQVLSPNERVQLHSSKARFFAKKAKSAEISKEYHNLQVWAIKNNKKYSKASLVKFAVKNVEKRRAKSAFKPTT